MFQVILHAKSLFNGIVSMFQVILHAKSLFNGIVSMFQVTLRAKSLFTLIVNLVWGLLGFFTFNFNLKRVLTIFDIYENSTECRNVEFKLKCDIWNQSIDIPFKCHSFYYLPFFVCNSFQLFTGVEERGGGSEEREDIVFLNICLILKNFSIGLNQASTRHFCREIKAFFLKTWIVHTE